MAEILSKNILRYNGIPLSINKVPLAYIEYAPPEIPLLEFMTNDVGGSSFDPVFTVSSGILSWDLGDGSTLNANSFTHVYSLAGDKTVKVYNGTTPGASAITNIEMQSDKLVGTLDISSLTGLSSISLDTNPSLNYVINPVSSQVYTTYRIPSSNLLGTLDVSGLTSLGGSFNVQYNPKLQKILNPVSTQIFTGYYANDCSLEGIIDLRGLSNLGGTFTVSNNKPLTQILHTASPRIFSTYHAYSCNLTGTLDVSSLTGLGGQFQVEENPLLTKILFPSSTTKFTAFSVNNCSLNNLDLSSLPGLGGGIAMNSNTNLTSLTLPSTINHQIFNFNARNCSLNTTSVDSIFSKLRIFWDASLPSQNTEIYVDQGTNSPPTDNYSNTDIVKIQSIFDNSTAYDVSIHINVEPAIEYNKFTLIIDTSQYVDLGDTSVPYSGTNNPTSMVWSNTDTFAEGVNMYKGKVYWACGQWFTAPQPILIMDVCTHSTEFLMSGYKSINGSYYVGGNTNCRTFPITPSGYLLSTTWIGSGVGFWKYNINANTGSNIAKDDAYTGYKLYDSLATFAEQTSTQAIVYDENHNTAYVITQFGGYPYQIAFLQYDYDTSVMRRFDKLGFRDSSNDTPEQINGYPMCGDAGTDRYSQCFNQNSGLLFMEGDVSLWMYDTSANKGYVLTSTGKYDGTTTTAYASGSLIPNPTYPLRLITDENYLLFSATSSKIWKYDIPNNKIVGCLDYAYDYFVDDSSVKHDFKGYSPTGNLVGIVYDASNNILFLPFNEADSSNYLYVYNLNTYVCTKVDSSTILNSNTWGNYSSLISFGIDTGKRLLTYSPIHQSGTAGVNKKLMYELYY